VSAARPRTPSPHSLPYRRNDVRRERGVFVYAVLQRCASRGHGSRLPLPVSGLAAPTFWPAAQLNIDSSHRISASTHPLPIQSLVASHFQHIRSAAHPSEWCQSHRARPCSRSLTDLCLRSPSSASAVRTSRRQTPVWALCHQCWVCDTLSLGGLQKWP
jgi:hypothetical protein